MASTIYNDLKYIQEAEKVMDANLKATTGINTESFTLMEKANTILKKNNTTDYVVNYQRPEWYPNADDIINSAPKITYEDDTYYPYMLIFMREYQEEINNDKCGIIEQQLIPKWYKDIRHHGDYDSD